MSYRTDFIVVKLCRRGDLAQRDRRRSQQRRGPRRGRGRQVDVVASGFFIVPGAGADFAVVKLSGADGREVWRSVLNGAASQADLAVALAVDGDGDIVAAGAVQNSSAEPRPRTSSW